jgi:predicted aldo/keto reductase-like oxidoreductase
MRSITDNGLPTANEEQSFAILNEFVARGGNFIDTADVYGMGESEEVLGRYSSKGYRCTAFCWHYHSIQIIELIMTSLDGSRLKNVKT